MFYHWHSNNYHAVAAALAFAVSNSVGNDVGPGDAAAASSGMDAAAAASGMGAHAQLSKINQDKCRLYQVTMV